MQTINASPRDSFTEQEIIDLIEADVLNIDIGLELLDSSDVLVEDISDDFLGGQIDYERDSIINRVARISMVRDITWANQRLRPYMNLSDGINEARFNLGVFIPTTPRRISGDTVQIEVDCYDKLLLMQTPIGQAYEVLTNTAYLDAVVTLIEAVGETNYELDQTLAATTLPTTRIWEASNDITYLTVANELLEAIGYRNLWVDEDGVFRTEPMELLEDRTAEWTYDATSSTTTVEEQINEEIDYFNVPNKFVFVRDDPSQAFPEDGDGMYTVTNQSDGTTSIDSRGRTITRVYYLDTADQTSLVLQGDRIVELEKQALSTVTMTVSPNPLHSHFDCVAVTESSLAISGNYEVRRWKLPLGGSQMVLELVS